MKRDGMFSVKNATKIKVTSKMMKEGDTSKIASKNIQIIKKVLKDLKFPLKNLKITKKEVDWLGTVDLKRNLIYLNYSIANDFETILSVTLHEYCHLLQKEHGVFMDVHGISDLKKITYNDYLKYVYMQFPAEMNTDILAKDLMSKIAPDLTFKSFYLSNIAEKKYSNIYKYPITYESYLHFIEFQEHLKRDKNAIFLDFYDYE